MKVTVYADRCRDHGMCLTLCPDVLSRTDDGYAVILHGLAKRTRDSALVL